MAKEPTIEITFAVDDPELDDRDRQKIAQTLLRQLRQMDEVEKIERTEDLHPEGGAKFGLATLVGFLTAKVKNENIKDFLSYLGDRFQDQPITINIKVGNKEVKIQAKSSRDLQDAENLAKNLIAAMSGQG